MISTVNTLMAFRFKISPKLGVMKASANQAADILAITEDSAFRNASKFLFTDLV